jgi:hypothetical protein
MPNIETNFDQNVITLGAAGFEAHADRLIILQDDYRSGLECPTCLDETKHTVQGREVSTVACPSCLGEGKRPKAGNAVLLVKCTECDGAGWIICPDCNGKGGTIILADDQKGRPTTGVIVSIGPEVKQTWTRGDKCIYPAHAGHAYDLKGLTREGKVVDVVLVILRDQEILSRMHGTLEQNQVKKSMALHTLA